MKGKTKRRICGTLAAGMMLMGSAVPAQAADAISVTCGDSSPKGRAENTTYWWGVTAHALTDAERDLAERIVMAEAGGESYDCMLAVAQTIRERSEHWGMTVEEVLTAKAQYAKPYKGKASEDAKEAVSAVFDRGERAYDAYTTHFHDLSVSPWWAKSKTLRGEIDGVRFYGVEVKK